MIERTHFALFIGAAALLALTPGPGILYVLGRTLHGGRGEGIQSAVGTFFGRLISRPGCRIGTLFDFADLSDGVRGRALCRGSLPHMPRNFYDSEPPRKIDHTERGGKI